MMTKCLFELTAAILKTYRNYRDEKLAKTSLFLATFNHKLLLKIVHHRTIDYLNCNCNETTHKKDNFERTQTCRLLGKNSCNSGQRLVLKAKICFKYTGSQIHQIKWFLLPLPCVHFNFSEPKRLENIFYVIGW